MRLCDMVIEMGLALPFFDKMKVTGAGNIAEQFIPGTSGLFSDRGDDHPDFFNEIAFSFRYNGACGVNKYHEESPE